VARIGVVAQLKQRDSRPRHMLGPFVVEGPGCFIQAHACIRGVLWLRVRLACRFDGRVGLVE
jgi:hypothetical protein